MIKIKNNIPQSLGITYDVATEDGKTAGEISAAKFFLAKYPGQADGKYFIKQFGAGLSYSGGVWTVQIDQGDLDAAEGKGPLYAVLGIQYAGDIAFREPDLYEGSVPLRIMVEANYSE